MTDFSYISDNYCNANTVAGVQCLGEGWSLGVVVEFGCWGGFWLLGVELGHLSEGWSYSVLVSVIVHEMVVSWQAAIDLCVQ